MRALPYRITGTETVDRERESAACSRQSRFDQVCNFPRNGSGVLFHGELPENLFQFRRSHERPKPVDGIVGNQLAPMQNNDSLADTLHSFEFVRTKEDDLSARGKLLNQTA